MRDGQKYRSVLMCGQGLGRNRTGILVTRKSREDRGERTSEWTQTVEIFVSHANAHQKAHTAEETLNNWVDKMMCSLPTNQPFSPSSPVFGKRNNGPM